MNSSLDICNSVNFVSFIYFLKCIITAITIVVPIVLIIMATLDIVKAVAASDEQKKLYTRCIKRFIYAFLFFFVPTVINLMFSLIGIENYIGTKDYNNALCYNEATKENIKILKAQREQRLSNIEAESNKQVLEELNKAKAKVKEAKEKLEKSTALKDQEESENNSSDGDNSSSSDSNSNSSNKIMIIAGHAASPRDTGTTNEAKMTRELALEIETILKKYVNVTIFNRDVLGEDITKVGFKTSALEYILDCSDPNGLKYSKTVCPDSNALNKEYDFKPYAYVLELHFNGGGGPGSFITVANTCADSSSKKCMQQSDNAAKISKFANPIMKYMKQEAGIGYNASSRNGIRDDWYALERYVRVSTDYKTPASLIEVCAVDHDLGIYNKNKAAKAISHGIVEGLGLKWNE